MIAVESEEMTKNKHLAFNSSSFFFLPFEAVSVVNSTHKQKQATEIGEK